MSNQTTQTVNKEVTATKATPLWKDSTRNGSTVQFVSSWSRLEKEEPQLSYGN